MSEPSATKRPRRGGRKTTRKNELTDELASGSEAFDSRDAPSISIQEDILVYRTEPGDVVLLKEPEPDSDNEAQGTHRAATPSMSQRVADAAQAAKDTVQDTLTSAIDQGREHLPFNWPALLGLLLLTLLAGHGLSTLLRPHFKSDDISFFNRSIDQANHRYKQLGEYVSRTEGKLKDTEHRLKDALKQVLHLQSSHSDSESHQSLLQDQMHKLSDKVSQASHFLGSKSKGGWLSRDSDSEAEEEEGKDNSGLPSAIENPIKYLIQQQLEIFAADKTGLPDYANFYAGGHVEAHSQVYSSANPPLTDLAYWGCYLFPGCHPLAPSADQKLLTPAMAPGQCFPLNGSSGFVDIRLHNRIAVTGFSLEHIPSSIAYDVTSAPAVVSLQALDPPITHKVKGGGFTPRKTYGTFRYNLKANSAVQTFSIFSETQVPVTHVRLKVHSNHGHPLFTCLYRIRVHGEPVDLPLY